MKAVEGMFLGVCSLFHHNYNLVSVILIVSHPYNSTTVYSDYYQKQAIVPSAAAVTEYKALHMPVINLKVVTLNLIYGSKTSVSGGGGGGKKEPFTQLN